MGTINSMSLAVAIRGVASLAKGKGTVRSVYTPPKR